MTGSGTWRDCDILQRSARTVGSMMDARSEEPAKSNDLFCNQNFYLRGQFDTRQTINCQHFMASEKNVGNMTAKDLKK